MAHNVATRLSIQIQIAFLAQKKKLKMKKKYTKFKQ